MAPTFAPVATTYASRLPYITAAEYAAAPTGVNVSDIVPGGSTALNADALNNMISNASSWVDSKLGQTIGATLETQAGRYPIRNGRVRIPFSQSPLVALYTIQAGYDPSSLTSLTDFTRIEIGQKAITIPAEVLTYGSTQFGFRNPYLTDFWIVVTYVAGFATSLLTAATLTGVSSLPVNTDLGVAPGMSLTIYDVGNIEVVSILSTSGTAMVLNGVTAHAHPSGVAVSALPAAIRQATILLTTSLIKTRAAQSFVLQSAKMQPRMKEREGTGATEEEKLADSMLAQFRRVI